eukprot:4226114-Prymnesium_polylepis.1
MSTSGLFERTLRARKETVTGTVGGHGGGNDGRTRQQARQLRAAALHSDARGGGHAGHEEFE